MAGIYRTRPTADSIAPALDVPAVALGDDIFMSPGVSNSYAIATDAGRVIVNAGLIFEGPLRRSAYAAVPGPTHTIITTQGHPDHWGGIAYLREPGTDTIMHSNYRLWRDDTQRLLGFRARNTAFGFGNISKILVERIQKMDFTGIDMSFPEPTTTFDDRLELRIGGREFVLIATPGGETTDALVVWMPAERTLFTGNLFGPLFGVVPNLSTIRGDRYRDPLRYVEALDTVLDLGAERLITGHFDPIDGTDVIEEEVRAMRDAMQWVHDRTFEGMEAGKDVHTLMSEIRLPEEFDVGQWYGKTSWNVRSIWEMYAGWFHHQSTTELYDVPIRAVATDLVHAKGPDELVEAARAHLRAGRAVHALHLTETVLADGDSSSAREIAIQAHELLLADTDNFWEKAWLSTTIEKLRTQQ
ncbi:alkyl sulfatase dimerization domain-containing protein [Nocardia sp. NPDC057455]|uniref:alkyl sulfatase dimerization domain-containing protein n=1 Tax=Nocardia sp. NPDC057455 TaxID=3346138 RepID=UPI00366CC60B